jgi:hypothetical protein
MNRRPDRWPLRPLRRRSARNLDRLSERRHVFDRHVEPQLETLRFGGVDDGHVTPPDGLLMLDELVVKGGGDVGGAGNWRSGAAGFGAGRGG